MAILTNLPGVQVTVQIASEDAKEYDAGEEEQPPAEHPACPIVTKYIESIDDAQFVIKVTASSDYEWGYQNHALRATVNIDGNHISSKTISSPRESTISNKKAFCQQSQNWKKYELRFSAVSTIEDHHQERLEGDLEAVKHLGLIRVTIDRCIVRQSAPRTKRRSVHRIQKFEFLEKSLKGKAISHGTSLSSLQIIQPPRTTHLTPLREDNGPIAVFNFLYRSRDALQQSLIIPRDPPSSSTQTFSNLSAAEIERLAKERFEQIKREKDETEPMERKRITQFVDLTDD
ncbi:hypothetical protein GGR58DRAFT_529297 [Xylaria digitata]|nr:hypothetical protein GGR58DRAFT_529297 [Xylaria digitata]